MDEGNFKKKKNLNVPFYDEEAESLLSWKSECRSISHGEINRRVKDFVRKDLDKMKKERDK